MANCVVCGARLAAARGLCRPCYQRQRRQDPEVRAKAAEYQRQRYQQDPEVRAKKVEYERQRRQARNPIIDPIQEALRQIAEMTPAFSAIHRIAATGSGRDALAAVIAAAHPASEVRRVAEGVDSSWAKHVH